jgi:hypothetical protein
MCTISALGSRGGVCVGHNPFGREGVGGGMGGKIRVKMSVILSWIGFWKRASSIVNLLFVFVGYVECCWFGSCAYACFQELEHRLYLQKFT